MNDVAYIFIFLCFSYCSFNDFNYKWRYCIIEIKKKKSFENAVDYMHSRVLQVLYYLSVTPVILYLFRCNLWRVRCEVCRMICLPPRKNSRLPWRNMNRYGTSLWLRVYKACYRQNIVKSSDRSINVSRDLS